MTELDCGADTLGLSKPDSLPEAIATYKKQSGARS